MRFTRVEQLVAFAGAALALACTSHTESDEEDAADDGFFPPFDAGPCNAVIEKHEQMTTVHVAECSYLTWDTNPPSSGPHYPSWAKWGNYDVPIPRGYYVHNLEHSGIAFLHNCPEGCDDEVQQAKDLWPTLSDPKCATSTPPFRGIVTPDPLIDRKWAAAAWQWTLTADCFDPVIFKMFAEQRVGHTYENLCFDGIDLLDDAGGLEVIEGCGTEDAAIPDGSTTDAGMDVSSDAVAEGDGGTGSGDAGDAMVE